MGEFLSQSPVTTIRVDLRTLKYGGAPFVIAPQQTPVYEVILQRVIGRSFSQFALRIGQGEYPMRGQGDRYHFSGGCDSGIYLVLPRWANVNPGGSGVGIVEIAIVHQPDVTLFVPQTDPWALTRIVSGQASATVAAGVQPFISLFNPFNPANPLALANAKVMAHVRRWLITCSIDGLVQLENGTLNTPVAAAGFSENDLQVDTATAGPAVCGFAARQLDASNGFTKNFGVKASEALVLPVDTDLWPSVTNNQVNGLGVIGPAGPCTLTVTAEWNELELL